MKRGIAASCGLAILWITAVLGIAPGLAVQPLRAETMVDQSESAGATYGGLTKSTRFYLGTIIASDPSILRTSQGYEVYYTDLDTATNRTVIAKAYSTDGENWATRWTKGGVNGLVVSGSSGQWNENVESAAIVKLKKGWRLYFSGYRDEGKPSKGFPAALWFMASPDGINFQPVLNGPVMAPTKGWYDNDAIYSPTILRQDGTYYMIYVGHCYTNCSNIANPGVYLLLATSRDGISWTKSKTPVASPGQFSDWRADGIAEPYLIRRGSGSYLLFFTGLQGENRAIGVASATSPKGPWKFGSEPIVLPGASGAPDEHQVLAPAAVVENGELKLWYLAADKKELLSIGHAEGSVQSAISASGQ